MKIYTAHAIARMGQRGIDGKMIDYVLRQGEVEGIKYTTSQHLVNQQISELKAKSTKLQRLLKRFKRLGVAKLITDKLAQIKADLKIAAKIRDKHGITVICDNGVIITTYNNIQN